MMFISAVRSLSDFVAILIAYGGFDKSHPLSLLFLIGADAAIITCSCCACVLCLRLNMMGTSGGGGAALLGGNPCCLASPKGSLHGSEQKFAGSFMSIHAPSISIPV